MKGFIHKTSLALAVACLLALVAGIAYEAATHKLPFEGYLGGLFSWAWIFGIVNYISRPRKSVTASLLNPDAPPDSD